MIYIASDHGGYKLKQKLVKFLESKNMEIEDLGPSEYNEEDDYPDFVFPVMRKVQESSQNKGILICRNGVGVNILANKHIGIRAGLSWNQKHAKSQRNDDNTNVLTLPADFISLGKAKKITFSWLKTPFSEKGKHLRRLEKITAYDNSGSI